MPIETEIRGIITKEEFDSAARLLDLSCDKKWEDNRETYFFIIPSLNLKIAKLVSKNTAKVALKLGQESKISNQELEITIKPEEVETALKIFTSLGFESYRKSDQVRTNYIYKGVEIALKWSQDWSYHFEMEILSEEDSEAQKAHTKLLEIAGELGLKAMNQDEIENHIQKLRKQQGFV